MVRLNELNRGNKNGKQVRKNKEKFKERRRGRYRQWKWKRRKGSWKGYYGFQNSNVLEMDKDSIFEGDLTLTDIHAWILEHEGQILKDCDVDDLLGLSKDSFGEASAIGKLVDLTLSSDGEHDITVISFQNRLVDSSPPADEAKGTQSKLSGEGCSLGANDAKIVRQAAVKKSPSASPRNISKAGRTKLDRAKNGTRKSLAFLAKMKQRDQEAPTGCG